MFLGGFKISKNYAFDYMLFHKVRNFKDGVTFFDFECNLDLFKGHHNPKFNLSLFLFNYTIFEFEIYNVNHVKTEGKMITSYDPFDDFHPDTHE